MLAHGCPHDGLFRRPERTVVGHDDAVALARAVRPKALGGRHVHERGQLRAQPIRLGLGRGRVAAPEAPHDDREADVADRSAETRRGFLDGVRRRDKTRGLAITRCKDLRRVQQAPTHQLFVSSVAVVAGLQQGIQMLAQSTRSTKSTFRYGVMQQWSRRPTRAWERSLTP